VAEPDDPPPYEVPDERVAEAWQRLLGTYLTVEPLEPGFARTLLERGTGRFAELGSATGPISRLLQPAGVECVAVDLNPPPGHVEPMVRADLRHVPLRTGAFDAVSAVNCLYFLADPAPAVEEAHRLLRPGGTFLASAPSRYHDPELRHVLDGWGEASPFDAEEADAIVRHTFDGDGDDVDVRWWEAPAYHLPDRQAVVDYLVAFRQPDAEARAAEVPTPTAVTKSGCDVWVRKNLR
jgi:SAM-dependent methyltransferase